MDILKNTLFSALNNSKDIGIESTQANAASLDSILATVYFWAGIIAVLVIVIGGIRYTTSGGDPAQVKAAKNTILYAIVGIVVIIMAAAITQFVLNGVSGESASGGGQAPPPASTP